VVLASFFNLFFSFVGYPERESNPGRWDGNAASNLLDHPDSPTLKYETIQNDCLGTKAAFC